MFFMKSSMKYILGIHLLALFMLLYFFYYLIKTSDGEFAAVYLLILYIFIFFVLVISILTSIGFRAEKVNFAVGLQFLFSLFVLIIGASILIYNLIS